MILYQQSLVSIMANQTASNIAQVYSNSFKDPFTGYVDSDSVYQSITYSSMKTDAYVDVMEQKADTLAYYRLKSSRILTNGNPSVEVVRSMYLSKKAETSYSVIPSNVPITEWMVYDRIQLSM